MKALNKISSLADYFEVKLGQANQIPSLMVSKFKPLSEAAHAYVSKPLDPNMQWAAEKVSNLLLASDSIIREFSKNTVVNLPEALNFVSKALGKTFSTLEDVDSFITKSIFFIRGL